MKILSSSKIAVGEHYMIQPFPQHNLEQVDPFILLHHHGPHDFEPHNQGLPFGPHPHRGFETLTVIYDGEIEHADSHGHASVIKAGGVQWMTAGRGVVHSENLSEAMRQNGGAMHIIQLWMNLPSKLKMVQPNYQGFQKNEIPVFVSDDKKVETQIISGNLNDIKGCAKSLTDLSIFNIKGQKGGKMSINVPLGKNILCYVLKGEVLVNSKLAIDHQLVQLDENTENVNLEFQTDGLVLFGFGDKINEPMVSHGPFVMNTTTEILQAMRDYQMGKMGVM